MAQIGPGAELEWRSLIESLEQHRDLAVRFNDRTGAEWHGYMMAGLKDFIRTNFPAPTESYRGKPPPSTNGKRKRPLVEEEDIVDERPGAMDLYSPTYLYAEAANTTGEATSTSTPTFRIERLGPVRLQVQSVGAAKVMTRGTVTFEPLLGARSEDTNPEGANLGSSVDFDLNLPMTVETAVTTDADTTFIFHFDQRAKITILYPAKLENFHLKGHSRLICGDKGQKTLWAQPGAVLQLRTKGASMVDVASGVPAVEMRKQLAAAANNKQTLEKDFIRS